MIWLNLFISFCMAQQKSPGVFSGVQETQSQRAAERFNILDWIWSNRKATSSQDSKYGRGAKGGGPTTDIVLQYFTDSGDVKREGTLLGKDYRSTARVQVLLDNLFTAGNKFRSMNVDLGLEGFLGQTTKFEVASPGTQEQHSFSELGGGLMIRPVGRSSQDSGFIVKGGYVGVTETGLWSNSTLPQALYGPYLAAEGKLYLLPILGGRVEYQSVLETEVSSLNSKWKMQRFIYGGFLEISLINAGVYLVTTEHVLTHSATGAITKETYTGVGAMGLMHF